MGKNFLLVVLLVILSFYAWRFLPTWIIQGQGFMYFDPRTQDTYLTPGLLTTAQVAGVLLSIVFVKLIGVNMPIYMWIQLIGMLFLGVLFFVIMKVVTKNRFIAFAASLMYTVSYFGSYAMYMVDYSAHFLERASVNVVLLLLSFLFLHLYLEKTKQKFVIVSLLLYFLGILSSHFSILFTFPFFFYPLFWYFFNKESIVKGFALGMAYVLISGFFVYLSSVGVEPVLQRHTSFLEFLLNPQKTRYPEGMLMQLAYWSQYPSIIKALVYDLYPLSYFTYETVAPYNPFIVILYISAIVIIYKLLPALRALLLTTIFATTTIFLFNIYLGRFDPIYLADTNRYLYFPTYLLAIFWSLFLWSIFKHKNFGLKMIALMLLAGYYYINIYLIFINFSRSYFTARPQKALYNYIIVNRDKLKPSTLVIAPYPAIAQYEGPFFTAYLGKGQVRYVSSSANISEWPKFASSSSHVVQLTYGIECQCVLEKTLK